MSLDLSLVTRGRHTCECSHCGHRHEASGEKELYSANITHNLTTMAEEAGIYRALWHPEEAGVKYARDLAPLLTRALDLMKEKPGLFRPFNASNGWGTYDQFVPWLSHLLTACENHPDATVEVSI